ncbi:unnamed protein product [Brachionus calyciflorus]|uniref:Uncharacterized protein n=1 Tax=Brachionus calyciflorus TaxID=104777 RepID=A0A814KKK1_9BILA|nr:unnamed protein product [Brachionus calyciflorus]
MDETEIRLDDHDNYTYDICRAQRIKVTASGNEMNKISIAFCATEEDTTSAIILPSNSIAAYAVKDEYVPLFNELTGVKTNHKEDTDEINLIAESINKSLMFSTTLLEPYDPDNLGNSIIDADNDLDSNRVVSSKICVNMSYEAVLEPFRPKSSLNSKVSRALM